MFMLANFLDLLGWGMGDGGWGMGDGGGTRLILYDGIYLQFLWVVMF